MQVKDGPVPAGPFPLVAAHPLASWALGFFHGMRGASGANRLTGPRQKGERVHVAAFAHVCVPAFHALTEAVGEGLILIGMV